MMPFFSFDKQPFKRVVLIVCIGCGLTGCGCSSRPPEPVLPVSKQPAAKPAPSVRPVEPVVLEPPANKMAVREPIRPASIKLPFKPVVGDDETITIDGREYKIPVQWQGRKVDFKPFPQSDLVSIPPEFTKNGASIYLRKAAVEALVSMGQKAREENIILLVDSGYRSARYQRVIFKRMIRQGRSFEDIVRYVAPPGYSEHMLGTVIDFAPGNWLFADTPEYRWLCDHAATFGFSETYPENNSEKIPWESWHWKWSDQRPYSAK